MIVKKIAISACSEPHGRPHTDQNTLKTIHQSMNMEKGIIRLFLRRQRFRRCFCACSRPSLRSCGLETTTVTPAAFLRRLSLGRINACVYLERLGRPLLLYGESPVRLSVCPHHHRPCVRHRLSAGSSVSSPSGPSRRQPRGHGLAALSRANGFRLSTNHRVGSLASILFILAFTSVHHVKDHLLLRSLRRDSISISVSSRGR